MVQQAIKQLAQNAIRLGMNINDYDQLHAAARELSDAQRTALIQYIQKGNTRVFLMRLKEEIAEQREFVKIIPSMFK